MEPVICGGNARWSICMTLLGGFLLLTVAKEARETDSIYLEVVNIRADDYDTLPGLFFLFHPVVRSEHGYESFSSLGGFHRKPPSVLAKGHS
jgi:hypothetical protein